MDQKEKVDARKYQKKLDQEWEGEEYRLKVDMNRVLALVLVVLLIPVYMMIAILVLVFSGWPIFFVQKRVGYLGKIFKMFKFRTMRNGSEKNKNKLLDRNEANGPVFKIWNDPRFTGIGKLLSHSGLDELPQLFNVVIGDMKVVGPRPLPVGEERQVEVFYRKIRESVKPGIISPWIFGGYHKLSFKKWMEEDKKYVETKCWQGDVWLVIQGGCLLVKLVFDECVELVRQKWLTRL